MMSREAADSQIIGYGQGAAATAEAIRNRLLRALADGARSGMRAEVVKVIKELESDYDLEPTQE